MIFNLKKKTKIQKYAKYRKKPVNSVISDVSKKGKMVKISTSECGGPIYGVNIILQIIPTRYYYNIACRNSNNWSISIIYGRRQFSFRAKLEGKRLEPAALIGGRYQRTNASLLLCFIYIDLLMADMNVLI